jgi:hypothetical protein
MERAKHKGGYTFCSSRTCYMLPFASFRLVIKILVFLLQSNKERFGQVMFVRDLAPAPKPLDKLFEIS